jgi:hypothetical protein
VAASRRACRETTVWPVADPTSRPACIRQPEGLVLVLVTGPSADVLLEVVHVVTVLAADLDCIAKALSGDEPVRAPLRSISAW